MIYIHKAFFDGKKNKVLLILALFLFAFLFGCTSADTFIIQNNSFDSNVTGNSGEIAFIDKNGTNLATQTGFDFNSDTNTLSAKNISTRIIYNDNNKEWGTVFCPDGNIITGYIEGFSC